MPTPHSSHFFPLTLPPFLHTFTSLIIRAQYVKRMNKVRLLIGSFLDGVDGFLEVTVAKVEYDPVTSYIKPKGKVLSDSM
jgi:hypothetical protein